MSMDRSLAIATKVDLSAPANKTANFNSTAVDIRDAMGNFLILVNFFCHTGTTPTLAITLQTGDASDGSDAANVTGYAIAAAVSGNVCWVVNKTKLKRYVRLAATIAGTASPAAVVSAEAIYYKKYIG